MDWVPLTRVQSEFRSAYAGTSSIKFGCKHRAISGFGTLFMGPIFSPAADTWMRLFMVGVVSLVVGGIVFSVGIARSDWVTGA
jgi:hypothetical protein